MGLSALHVAATAGRTEVCAGLLELLSPANVAAALEQVTPAGLTPLLCGVAEGHVDTVRRLLAAGASVRARDTSNGDTALLVALRLLRSPATEPMVELLLEHDADGFLVKTANQLGETPVHLCASLGLQPLLERLSAHRQQCVANFLQARQFGAVTELSADALGLCPRMPPGDTPLSRALQAHHGDLALWILQHTDEASVSLLRQFLEQQQELTWFDHTSVATSHELEGLLVQRTTQPLLDQWDSLESVPPLSLLDRTTALLTALVPVRSTLHRLAHHEPLLRLATHPAMLAGLMAAMTQTSSDASSMAAYGRLVQALPWNNGTHAPLMAALQPLLACLLANYVACWSWLAPILHAAVPQYLRTHSALVLETLQAQAETFQVREIELLLHLLDANASASAPQPLAEQIETSRTITRLTALRRNQDCERLLARLLGTYFPAYVERCGVCCDPLVNPCAVGKAYGTTQVHKKVCEHEFCRDCLRQWIKSEIGLMHAHIHCPEPDCFFSFFADDIQRIAPECYEDFLRLRNGDHRQRLIEMLQNHSREASWVSSNARVCPTCYVVIERSEGCDSMFCGVCAKYFNYGQAPRLNTLTVERLKAGMMQTPAVNAPDPLEALVADARQLQVQAMAIT